jgi:calpain-15
MKVPNWKVFDRYMDANDIWQGELGDCYFLSSLASIAETPKRIQRLFITKEVNPYGIYCVLLCIRGEWREVYIDDRFPCREDSRGNLVPVFSRAKKNELWVLIMEKAWAKLHGSYAKIEAGLSREALHELTAAPTKPFFMDNKNLFNEIKEATLRRWVMTAGSNVKASRVGSFKTGLLSTHSYSILAAIELDTAYGRVELLKMRNPWGDFEWNGDWSDKSSLWTPQLKALVGYSDANDGIFFMSVDDFRAHFHDLQICMVEDKYKYSAVAVRSTAKSGLYFHVAITRESEYYFTINQESKRKFPSNSPYEYSNVRVLLARREPNGDLKPVSGVSKAEMEVWTSGKLSPGDYVLYTKVEWKRGGVNEATLSSYGMEEVRFKHISKRSIPGFKSQFFKHVALSNTQKRYVMTNTGLVRYNDITSMGYGYWYYTNPGAHAVEEEIILINPQGLRFRKPNHPSRAKVIIPAGGEALVLAVIGSEGYTCMISYRTKYQA